MRNIIIAKNIRKKKHKKQTLYLTENQELSSYESCQHEKDLLKTRKYQ